MRHFAGTPCGGCDRDQKLSGQNEEPALVIEMGGQLLESEQ